MRATRLAAIGLTLGLTGVPSPIAGHGATGLAPAATVAGQTLPVLRSCQYTMAGRIRPLLAFWIGKDNVGLARIAWRLGEDGTRGYDLLVGSDPARAPRGLNRWGFIAEEVRGRDGALMAVMSRSDEESLSEARASTERRVPGGDFKAIRAQVVDGVATSSVAGVSTTTPLTVHQLSALLDAVQVQTASAASRDVRVSPDVRPGFLVAVAELVDATLHTGLSSRASRGVATLTPVKYVFGQTLRELRLTSLDAVGKRSTGRPGTDRLVEASFEIRTLATGARTRFHLVYATDGELAGVPVSIAWQPRWWLKVELTLDQTNPACL